MRFTPIVRFLETELCSFFSNPYKLSSYEFIGSFKIILYGKAVFKIQIPPKTKKEMENLPTSPNPLFLSLT